MKKQYVTLTGIGSFFPIVLYALRPRIESFFMVYIKGNLLGKPSDALSDPTNLFGLFSSIQIQPILDDFMTIVNLPLSVIGIGMQIYFIYDLFKNPNVAKSQRTAWLTALVVLSIIALPVYWHININKPARLENIDRPELS